MSSPLQIAVVGHVEHVTIGRAPALPKEGEILHLLEPRMFAGGGGGVAFFQLTRSPAELHLFTALGSDDTAGAVARWLKDTGAKVHAAGRRARHGRAVVLVTHGERTIIVTGPPLHPELSDDLPFDVLDRCHAVYFTSLDPRLLARCRAAMKLVVSARRRESLNQAGIVADVVIGSGSDPREASTLADYPVPPLALVMTEGAQGGRIETADGVRRFAAPPGVLATGGSYGAGDSFAAALTFFLAAGFSVHEAAERAAPYGAAVLAALSPAEAQKTLSL